MSNIITNDQLNNIDLDHSIFNKFQSYLEQNTDLLYPFMNNVLRMADGQNSIFDICEKSKIPFHFGKAYIDQLQKRIG